MDNIIVPSLNRSIGVEKLKCVLRTAADSGLKIKWKKRQFLQTKVEFLGFIVENGTIKPAQQINNK